MRAQDCCLSPVDLLHKEDTKYLMNLDPYAIGVLEAKKADGNKTFMEDFADFTRNKDHVDQALEDLIEHYSVLAKRRRALEEVNQCMPLKRALGLHIQCQETWDKSLKEYRKHEHPPDCAVGAALPLRPAGSGPPKSGSPQATSMLETGTSTSSSSSSCRGKKSRDGGTCIASTITHVPFKHGASARHIACRRYDSFLFSSDGDESHDHEEGEKHEGDEEKPVRPPITFHAAVDDADATSTYTAGDDVRYSFLPQMALTPGTGYWCSKGYHKYHDVVAFRGKLHARRPAKGIRVSWAYGPGEARLKVSPDGLLWSEAVQWHSPLRQREVSYEEEMMFDRRRNVIEFELQMRHPKPWGYFGINQVSLIL